MRVALKVVKNVVILQFVKVAKKPTSFMNPNVSNPALLVYLALKEYVKVKIFEGF